MILSKIGYIKSTYRSTFSSIKIITSSSRVSFFSERKFSSTKNEKVENKLNKAAQELMNNWRPIYRFPKIRTVSALNKLKNYQLVATLFGLPATHFFFPEHLFTVGYTGSTLVLTLSFISYLLTNSVGFMYVKKTDENIIRIAYTNFWGSRKDSQFNRDDIVPFCDLPSSITDKFYTKLKFNNGHHELKLLSKEVEILDSDKFTSIFGE